MVFFNTKSSPRSDDYKVFVKGGGASSSNRPSKGGSTSGSFR